MSDATNISSTIFRKHKCCVVIPTYNNDKTLLSVIEGCRKYCNDVWVINDGSTDGTKNILDNIKNINVLHQPKNEGKGVALKRAFAETKKAGFDYCITIDSDGQHDPKDLFVFAEALEKDPGPIYIGARNMNQVSIPGTSKFGHKNSNFWFLVETGIKAEDTQSGYRLYPLLKLNINKLISWRYEFEIEIIVRAAWKGITVKFVPVNVFYPEDRVSHFRPFKDFTRVAILNIWLVFLAFIWFRPVMMIRELRKKKIRQIIRDHLIKPNEPIWKKSLATGLGIFCGIIPIWGFQTIAAISLSVIFRLNKPLTLLASNISIPPMIPIVIYCSLGVGEVLTEGTWTVSLPDEFSKEIIFRDLWRYVLGSIVLGLLAGSLGGLLTWITVNVFYRKKKNRASV